MSERETGGSAFPDHNLPQRHNGMTLRDYFAAVALPECLKMAGYQDSDDASGFAARCAYQAADAMLRARNT